MWHEARKQEKKLRGLMVDYKKRAERRRNYYEIIKKDPCSFLRLVGTSMKIHIDPSVATAAEGPRTMMAWNDDADNMIDRFDVRAHMDYIPDYKRLSSLPDALEVEDDMRCNYDRYRIIVQNDCAGISEEAALRQIDVDEKYGDITKHTDQEDKKKALASKKAAIAFSYDDSADSPPASDKNRRTGKSAADESDEEDEEDDFEDVDLDIAFDIDQINSELKQQLDIVATTFGMAVGEFAEQLRKDKEDEQELREARQVEVEKAAMSGRKSRRERRMYKETMLRLRGASPPKYQAPGSGPRSSPQYSRSSRGRSESDSSRSPSPANDTLEFITNLGEDSSKSTSHSNSVSASSSVELPPHLRASGKTTSSAQANWKKQRMRSESPVDFLSKSEPSSSTAKHRDTERIQKSPPPPMKQYRRASLDKSDSSNDSDVSSDEDKSSSRSHGSYRSRAENLSSSNTNKELSYQFSTKGSSLSFNKKLSAQERLKKKMQSALNKTYKADKRSAEEKREQARKEQMERADELRQQADEMRRKEYQRRRRSSSHSRSRSRSPSSSWRRHHSRRGRSRSRSRNRSKSPTRRNSKPLSYSSSNRRRSRSRSPGRYRSYR